MQNKYDFIFPFVLLLCVLVSSCNNQNYEQTTTSCFSDLPTEMNANNKYTPIENIVTEYETTVSDIGNKFDAAINISTEIETPSVSNGNDIAVESALPNELSGEFNCYSNLIEENFLGVWESETGQKFIIGINPNYDIPEYKNNGRIERVTQNGNIIQLFVKNYVGDEDRLEINKSVPNIILSYDEYKAAHDPEYIPEKFILIDSAEMYSDIGNYNQYIESMLYIKYGYFHGFGTDIGVYSNDSYQTSVQKFTILEEHSENKLIFVEAFEDTTSINRDNVVIRYELLRNGDYWEIGEWEIINNYIM